MVVVMVMVINMVIIMVILMVMVMLMVILIVIHIVMVRPVTIVKSCPFYDTDTKFFLENTPPTT